MLGPWYGWKLPWHCLHVPDGFDHHPWVPASYLEYHVGFFQGTISQTMICSECTGVPYAWCASYLAAWGWCAEKFGTQNLVAYVSLGFAATPLPGCGLVPYIWMDNGPFTKSSCATIYIILYIILMSMCVHPALKIWPRSSHTAGRDCFNSFLGNQGYSFVATGNLLCSRVALILWICLARSIRFVVEQPEGSSLPNHPRMQEIFACAVVTWPSFILKQILTP